MSNEIINRLLVTDSDGTTMTVRKRKFEEDDECMELSINNQYIFLDNDDDILALIAYAKSCLKNSLAQLNRGDV